MSAKLKSFTPRCKITLSQVLHLKSYFKVACGVSLRYVYVYCFSTECIVCILEL